MGPAIEIGDIVLVQKTSRYFPGEVITFYRMDGRLVTHRIVETDNKDKSEVYITKEDASRAEDQDVAQQEKIVGKVVLTLPKIGYLTALLKSLPGLIVLIYLPVGILILGELYSLLNYVLKD